MNFSSIRVPILVAGSVASVLIAGVAIGAVPREGRYAGSGDQAKIHFVVRDPESRPAKVKGFEIEGKLCGQRGVSFDTSKAIRVRPSGRFTYEGFRHGDALSIYAKFTRRKTARGELFIDACPLAGHYEFVIKKGAGDDVDNVPAG